MKEDPMSLDYVQHRADLNKLASKLSKELAGPMSGFAALHRSAIADGALSTKVKELIALALGINAHCDGCIAYHVHNALKAGATREEIIEAIGVAIMMGGGPAMVYGCQALDALDQFQNAAS
jgi:AhpD family alkylhydroperoxidase